MLFTVFTLYTFTYSYQPPTVILYSLHCTVSLNIKGSHTEFFDKFNIRASLATIFKAIWHFRPALKHRMIEFARLVLISHLICSYTSIFTYFCYYSVHVYT